MSRERVQGLDNLRGYPWPIPALGQTMTALCPLAPRGSQRSISTFLLSPTVLEQGALWGSDLSTGLTKGSHSGF